MAAIPTATRSLSDLHGDIIQSHILTRLDARSLTALSATSTHLRSLTSNHELWSRICHTTWPSTKDLQELITTFPNIGPLTFYSLSSSSLPHKISTASPPTPIPNLISALLLDAAAASSTSPPTTPPTYLISSVDVFYLGEPIISRTKRTPTHTTWFKSAPFRIDVLDPKESVATPIPAPRRDGMCLHLYENLHLSWILIDPAQHRSVNVSSGRPVEILRHWLTGEVQLRFATIIDLSGGDEDGSTVAVTVEVMCGAGGCEGAPGMIVRDVGLEVETVDGSRLNGARSVDILTTGMLDDDDDDGCGEGNRRRRMEKEMREVKKRFDGFMDVRTEIKYEQTGGRSWDLVRTGANVFVTAATTVSVGGGYFRGFWGQLN